ncbi:phage head-tail adapter protein, partial [Enterococcus faecium]
IVIPPAIFFYYSTLFDSRFKTLQQNQSMLKKTDIEPLVIEAIRELIKNQDFATEIKSKIGKEIDTSTLNRELKNYEAKLREVDLNKSRLENEIDSLPEDTRFRERKINDMTFRLDWI